MSTTSRVILLFCSLAFLSACSIYRNKGRDQFEARASGQVKTEIGVAGDETADELALTGDSSSCWLQDVSDPLWATPHGSKLEVRRLNDSQMSVCLQSPEPQSAAASQEPKND